MRAGAVDHSLIPLCVSVCPHYRKNLHTEHIHNSNRHIFEIVSQPPEREK